MGFDVEVRRGVPAFRAQFEIDFNAFGRLFFDVDMMQTAVQAEARCKVIVRDHSKSNGQLQVVFGERQFKKECS